MHEIVPQAELNRFTPKTAKSSPSTRSSSPGLGVDSPTLQAGAGGLSPPPPGHYLRDKARTGATEDSIKRLKKRSDIFERARRSRSFHSSSQTRDDLAFPHELQSRSPSSSRSHIALEYLGDDSPIPNTGPLAFLATDPMDLSSSKPRSLPDTLVSSFRPSGSDEGSAAEVASMDSHAPSSYRGMQRLGPSHRGRLSESSISLFSSNSTSLSPPSLDSHVANFPPTESVLLSPSSPNLQPLSPHIKSHDCSPYHCVCEGKSHSPPQSASVLFDVQKRRRAQAFDQFTSYTEALPFHRSGPRAENSDSSIISSADRTLHSRRSEPNLHTQDTWEKQLESDVSSLEGVTPLKEAHSGKPRRPCQRIVQGIKHIISPKAKSQPNGN